MSTYAKGFQSKIETKMANSVDPNETARDEPSDLNLHCLHRYLFLSAGLKAISPSLNGSRYVNFLEKQLD